MVRRDVFLIKISVLSDIARIMYPNITPLYHIFPFTDQKNKKIPSTLAASHPVSHNIKIHFSDIKFIS